MAKWQDELTAALAAPETVQVWYFASAEPALLQRAAAQVHAALGEDDDAYDRIDGPTPDMDAAVAAAGTLSFFGTRRLLALRGIQPAAMADKDIDELCGLMDELANAVLLITAETGDAKAAGRKKADKLLAAAQKAGRAWVLEKPNRRALVQDVESMAAQLHTTFAPGAAEDLVDRVGDDLYLLQNEVHKLASAAGFGQITRKAVERLSARNLEADVFGLVNQLTAGRRGATFERLEELLALRYDPIAVSASLAGSFVDMARVRYGVKAKRTTDQIFKEMGYRGNPYRLKKSREAAERYSDKQLQDSLFCLERLDRALKSSAFQDKTVLLEAAVAELLQIGGR